MLDSDQQPEIEAPDELLADMPLPSDAKTFFLGGIFVLLMLTAAYVARACVQLTRERIGIGHGTFCVSDRRGIPESANV